MEEIILLEDNEIIIIDEQTGRQFLEEDLVMDLHQSIE